MELVVFDWSGTLSDDRRPVYEAFMIMLEEAGVTGVSFEEWLPRARLHVVEALADFGVTGDPDKLYKHYQKTYTEIHDSGNGPVIYSDTKRVLTFLKSIGKKMAILSSHPQENLIREAKAYGVHDFFDLIMGNSKDKAPDLQKISDKLKVQPNKILYIGDTIFDIRAGKRAGVMCGGICTGYHAKDRLKLENPDFLFDCLSDIEKIKEFARK